MSNLTKEMEWLTYITECENSGLSVRRWCTINQISPDQYYYWSKKINTIKTETTQWASLSLDSAIQQNPIFEDTLFVHIDKYKIEVKEGFNTQMLTDVLKVVGALC